MEQRRPHICVVGSSNTDLFFRTTRLPRPGETLLGKSFHTGFGGKGANQAVMAARLGARVTMIGRVGRDVFGDDTLRNYRAEGIDTTFVTTDDERPTGVASIVVGDQAENCILVVAGANLGLTPEHIQTAKPALETADVLLTQLEVPVAATLEALRLARAAGVPTVLNPAPAQKLPDELLRQADYCIPNETELELLTGQAVATPGQAEVAARALRGRGPRVVIVTLGERGALVADEQGTSVIPTRKVEAVDPTGAGDAFIGSLAVFLAEGIGLRDAVARANVVAAVSVTRIGTQAAYPRRTEVEGGG